MKATVLKNLIRRVHTRLRTAVQPLRVDLWPVRQSPTTSEDNGSNAESIGMPGQSSAAIELALRVWAQWCAEHAGACVEVALSSHWLLLTVGDDALAVWQHYYGLSEDELQQHWVRRHVQVGAGQALHCAMPRALLEGLQEAARTHHIKLVWAGPWWIRELEQHVRAQQESGESLQPWSAREPGLTLHASLARQEGARQPVQLRQIWCEAGGA